MFVTSPSRLAKSVIAMESEMCSCVAGTCQRIPLIMESNVFRNAHVVKVLPLRLAGNAVMRRSQQSATPLLVLAAAVVSMTDWSWSEKAIC